MVKGCRGRRCGAAEEEDKGLQGRMMKGCFCKGGWCRAEYDGDVGLKRRKMKGCRGRWCWAAVEDGEGLQEIMVKGRRRRE